MTQSLGGVKTDNQRVNQERRHLATGLSGGSCFAYHLFLVFCFAGAVLSTTDLMADTYSYRGRYTNSSDIIYTFDGKHLYKGRYTNSSDILLTFDAPVPVIIMLLNAV